MIDDSAAWTAYHGRRVTVRAPVGSFAASRAPELVGTLDRASIELERLLRLAQDTADMSVEVLLIDPMPKGARLPSASPAPGDPDRLSELRIVYVVGPEASPGRLLKVIVRRLLMARLGGQTIAAEVVLRGIEGLVAARANAGPPRTEADAWVQARLTDRTSGPVTAARVPARSTDRTQPPCQLAVIRPDYTQIIELAGQRYVIGRDDDADLVLADPQISRRHATLSRDGGSLLIEDVGSRNGIAVNGQPVLEARLIDGDRISLGTFELLVLSGASPDDEGHDGLPATSFVAYLLDEHGADAVRRCLMTMDPARADAAVISAFNYPLGVLEEMWLAKLRRQSATGAQVRSFLSQLVPWLKPYRAKLIAITILLLLSTANTLALPLGFRYLIDNILPSHDIKSLILFTAVLAGVFLAANVIALVRVYLSSRLSERIGADLQERMFAHVMSLSQQFFTRSATGDLMARFTRDLTVVQQAMISLASGPLVLVISAIAAYVTLLVLNVWLALLVVSVVPVYVLAHVFLNGRLRTLSYQRQQRAAEMVSLLQEAIGAQDMVKAYNAQSELCSAYRARVRRMLGSAYRLAMTGAGMQSSVGLMATLAQLEIICLGGLLAFEGHLSLGTLLASMSLAPSVTQPINQLSQTAQSAQSAAGSMARIRELLEEPPEAQAGEPGVELGAPRDAITLENVTLSYGRGRPAVDGLSLRIGVGEQVAFVGATGAGKSSVLSLLLRFWDPVSGRVLIDGTDIRGVSLDSLRSQFGVILQDTFIFNTTVRANIAIGRPDATDREIAHAAEMAQLGEFVRELPAGYATVLGDRGVRMSGGQRQRLAIARALVRNPPVLILDEATSALDAATEAELLRGLTRASEGRTTLTITHRLTSVTGADRIFVMAHGQLVEEGTHRALLSANGTYRRLWDEQMGIAGVEMLPAVDAPAVEALARVPLLAEVPEPILEELARACTRQSYAPQAVITDTEDTTAGLIVILDGEVTLGSDGVQRTYGPGDFLFELALIRTEIPPAPLRAQTAVQLLVLTRAAFRAAANRHEQLQEAIGEQLVRRQSALASALSASEVHDRRALGL